ncbi:UDP-N-acetylmuramate dehydrogenase [Geobacter argillaceus]|uniref:UDP-N-acetylenolpyruvoylglucosamine reductase n=1 Tax=Geobacter argillaceus TaxID=345631 RepID=A0A562WTI9_9BACT|nr:UDP-N-acetylmuramate dehydrogenase [Geobacter argillaceus]TWJ33136.1 UDP-N-acetylmuramate dehydrogenase [Geobacter argillaceus]
MNRPNDGIFRQFRGELRENEPLAGHTSLRVGGPADWLALPADRDDLLGLLAVLESKRLPWLVIGGGYNLLVRDGGFRGVVISLERLAAVERLPGDRIRAEAGATNQQLARFCRDEWLTGLEFLAMIPGTVGGALAVNAGAYGAAVMERVVRLVTRTGGSLREWGATERTFGYRRHVMAPGEVILAAEFQLSPGDADTIDTLLADYRAHRQESQRISLPNAGSFFKNPLGEQAWRLIDRAGLRGCQVGGAQVAEAHANFLVNAGGATARDFLELAALVKERVRSTSGVELEEEVRIVGEDGGSGLGTGDW